MDSLAQYENDYEGWLFGRNQWPNPQAYGLVESLAALARERLHWLMNRALHGGRS